MNKEQVARLLINLNQLAMQEIRQKNYPQAISCFTQSLVLEEKLGLRVQMAESLFNMAGTYFLMGSYEQALHKSRLCETLFLQTGRPEDVARARKLTEEITAVTNS